MGWMFRAGQWQTLSPAKAGPSKPPPATSADVKDKGNAKRKRGAQEDAGEKRKRVRGPHQRKDWPNAVYCKRCNAKGITCHPQDVPEELEKSTTACYECALSKQACQWPVIPGAVENFHREGQAGEREGAAGYQCAQAEVKTCTQGEEIPVRSP